MDLNPLGVQGVMQTPRGRRQGGRRGSGAPASPLSTTF